MQKVDFQSNFDIFLHYPYIFPSGSFKGLPMELVMTPKTCESLLELHLEAEPSSLGQAVTQGPTQDLKGDL